MMEGRQRDYELYIREKKKLREKNRGERIERFIAAISEILCEHLDETQENDREKNIEKFDSLLVEKSEENLECAYEKKEEKYLREKEREIESIFVTSQESTIDTKISSSIANTIQVTSISLSPKKVVEEKINFTFEREQKSIKEIEEGVQKYIVGDVEKYWKFEKEKKINEFKRKGRVKTCRIFLNNPLIYYAGLDLRTNPFEEGENDDSMSSLSMWKESYKENFNSYTLEAKTHIIKKQS